MKPRKRGTDRRTYVCVCILYEYYIYTYIYTHIYMDIDMHIRGKKREQAREGGREGERDCKHNKRQPPERNLHHSLPEQCFFCFSAISI